MMESPATIVFFNFPKKVEVWVNVITGISRVQKRGSTLESRARGKKINTLHVSIILPVSNGF